MLGVVPGEVDDRPVAAGLRARVVALDALEQVVHEPQLRARVARRVERLVVPLQQPLGVGEVAVLLHVRCGRHQEDLRLDVLRAQLARLDLGRVAPERRRLELGEVADHQPLQVGERAPLQARVGAADGRVLAHHEQPVEAAVVGPQHRREVRVVARDLRQVVEAVAVLLRRRVAEVGLQQRDDVLVEVRPPALVGGVGGHVVGQRELALARLGHRQVARQQVVERRDVGRALDRRVPAHRHDPAARPAHVAEQQLEDRGRADHLHAGVVLGPAERVAEHRRLLAARVLHQQAGDLQELLLGHAADARDHLGRVARVVAHQLPEDGARVLERLVSLGLALHHPGALVLRERLRGVLALAGR